MHDMRGRDVGFGGSSRSSVRCTTSWGWTCGIGMWSATGRRPGTLSQASVACCVLQCVCGCGVPVSALTGRKRGQLSNLWGNANVCRQFSIAPKISRN